MGIRLLEYLKDVEVRRERNKVMDLDFMMGRNNQRSSNAAQRIGGEAHKYLCVLLRLQVEYSD